MLDLNTRAEDASINRLRQQGSEWRLIAIVHRQEARWLKLAEIRDAMVFGCHSGMDERQQRNDANEQKHAMNKPENGSHPPGINSDAGKEQKVQECKKPASRSPARHLKINWAGPCRAVVHSKIV